MTDPEITIENPGAPVNLDENKMPPAKTADVYPPLEPGETLPDQSAGAFRAGVSPSQQLEISMPNFTTWLHTAWTDLLSWFGTKAQKVASFLYPIFQDAEQLVEKDLLKDIINGIPVVAAALTGGFPAALAAAEAFVLPLLKAQGVELGQATVGVLTHALVAQAQASLDAAAPAA
jgi:hypothetical protein